MEPKLTPKARKELKEILQKQFEDTYPEELVDDLGITLLNLTAIALKHKINTKKTK